MSEPRTFKIDSPPMRGDDIKDWQQWMKMTFNRWSIDYPIKADGIYGAATRSATAAVAKAFGLLEPYDMQDGVTPELRTKLRYRRLTDAQRIRFEHGSAREYRDRLRLRYDGGGVAMPTPRVLADSWGYHPPFHDGVDLITPPNAPLYAICAGTIVRADTSGWWGKGAPSAVIAAKGDGIIILRAAEATGPIHKGMNICYGHAEHPVQHEGRKVKAGDRIGNVGFANAWHIHFMVNINDDTRGVGDRDPRPVYDYVRRNA